VPNDGISQLSPPLANPLSNSCAAFSERTMPEREPNTTTISLRPPRVAVATTLNPDAQMKPVFMPSASG
jgi:hypothetical protein